MEVHSVKIEKIENKGRALWVLGVFAHDWEGTMPAHTRAAAGSGGRPAGAGAGAGPGSLPGPVLFEPGLTGMGCAEHTRSAIRIRTAPPTAFCKPSWRLDSCDG